VVKDEAEKGAVLNLPPTSEVSAKKFAKTQSETDQPRIRIVKTKCKTYDNQYSLVVTHPTTSRPVRSLSIGEQTGSSIVSLTA
jgi:hypothetical protein